MPSDLHADQNPEATYHVSNYIVCVLDILGQKEQLKAWATMPADGVMSASFQSGMKKTVGTVLALHEGFARFFEKCRAAAPIAPVWRALATLDEQQRFERQKGAPLGVEQFSDTFVFYAPLVNVEGELLALPAYAVFGACCMAMLFSLGGKTAVRGGIDIAPGIKIPGLSFYGPALATAHRLESEVAKYPRIVVSPSVVGFVKQALPPSGCPRMDAFLGDMLAVCRDMLCVDSLDNSVIVDWLGCMARRILGSDTDGRAMQVLRSAHDFVGQTAETFQERAVADHKPEDVELAARYGLLYQYMLNRLPDWGVTLADDNQAAEGGEA